MESLEEVEEPSEDRTVAARKNTKEAWDHPDDVGTDAVGTSEEESPEVSEAPVTFDGCPSAAEGQNGTKKKRRKSVGTPSTVVSMALLSGGRKAGNI